MKPWESPAELGGGTDLVISNLNSMRFCAYFLILLSEWEHCGQTMSSLLRYRLEMMPVVLLSIGWWKVSVSCTAPHGTQGWSPGLGRRATGCWIAAGAASLSLYTYPLKNPLLSHVWVCSTEVFYDINLSCALQLCVSVCSAISGLFL